MATRRLYKLSEKFELLPFTRRLHHCRSSFVSFNVIHDPTRRVGGWAREKDDGCFLCSRTPTKTHIYNPPSSRRVFRQRGWLVSVVRSPSHTILEEGMRWLCWGGACGWREHEYRGGNCSMFLARTTNGGNTCKMGEDKMLDHYSERH